MLQTDLNHIETEAQLKEILNSSENVMICLGRMGPMCVPVYGIMEELEEEYKHVKFFDMEFDSPEADFLRSQPEAVRFTGLPFTYYFKKGKVVQATSSIQSRKQITDILDTEFGS